MKRNNNQKRKVALITGASSGIGNATALCLAESGYDIFMIARREDRLKQVKKDVEQLGAKAGYLAKDMTIESCPCEAIDCAISAFGRLDAIILCAGQGAVKSMQATELREFKEMFNVNSLSVVNFCKNGSEKISQGGAIVLVSSPAGVYGALGMTCYSLSKGGLVAFGKSLALELAPKKVRVNIIIPGAVETEFSNKLYKFLSKQQLDKIINGHPLGVGKPEDVAKAIRFLVSEDSSWITGSILTVDGGFTAGI